MVNCFLNKEKKNYEERYFVNQFNDVISSIKQNKIKIDIRIEVVR